MNNWLKHLLIVHVYKLFTDRHDLMKVADKFAERYEGKKIKIQTLIMHDTVFCKVYSEGSRIFGFFASIT